MCRCVGEGICCLDMSGAAREMRTLSDLRRDNYAPVDPEGGAPPPPPAGSWFDWWWLLLGGLLLIGLLALGALLASSILGAKTLHKLQNWPSPSPASTVAPSPSSAFTRPPTPTSAATRLPTISARPTPAPNCSCCVLCPTVNASACGCCQYCPSCDGQVSNALGVTTLNMILRAEGGNANPPDTIVAVGNNVDGGRVVAAVNTAIGIFNKQTHARISLTTGFFADGVAAGDPWVTWDAISERFFVTAFNSVSCGQGVIVYSPPAVVGSKCSTIARFGPQSFTTNGIVEVVTPLNGCAAISTNLTGKIALMVRGTCGFTIKVKNAQNAGAIGAIVYNNVPGIITMGGTDPTIIIPSVSISQADGLALAANLPANVTILSGGVTNYSTLMYISVSDTSAPNTRDDFEHYVVTDLNYATQFADYPKHSTDETVLYISSQNFGDYVSGSFFSNCLGPNIRAFNKTALMVGAGAFTLWDAIIPGDGVTNPRFVYPTEQRTPLSDQLLPMLFVGLSSGNDEGFCAVDSVPTPSTSLRIFAAGPFGLASFVGDVPFPTPMTFGACTPIGDGNCTFTPLIRQPVSVPLGIETQIGTIMAGVVYNGKMYTAMSHNISAIQTVIRWFEIDVEPIALNQQPVLLQWGDLNVSPDIDTFMPQIDVTGDGTMGIVFYTSGPLSPIVASYTVRLDSDPPGSVRVPFKTAVPNIYTYYLNSGNNRVRYGDYVGLQVDPVDRRTFYGFTQRPDPLGVFVPPGPCANASACIAQTWTTDLFTFRVEADTCATDGIVTEPVVLPSASVASAINPGPVFSGDASAFDLPEDDAGCHEDEEGEQECFE